MTVGKIKETHSPQRGWWWWWKEREGGGDQCRFGALLVREPVQGELPAISQKSDEGPTEADVHESM